MQEYNIGISASPLVLNKPLTAAYTLDLTQESTRPITEYPVCTGLYVWAASWDLGCDNVHTSLKGRFSKQRMIWGSDLAYTTHSLYNQWIVCWQLLQSIGVRGTVDFTFFTFLTSGLWQSLWRSLGLWSLGPGTRWWWVKIKEMVGWRCGAGCFRMTQI